MYADEIKVTKEFFVPLTPMCEGRPRCVLFQEVWKKYAEGYSREGFFDISHPRILGAIPTNLAKNNNEAMYLAQIATSIAVWFGTNLGYAFLEKLLKELDRKLPTYNISKNVETALSLWSIENSLHQRDGGWGGRRLQQILQNPKQGEDLLPLTHVETDAAESFITWLASDEGMRLLDLLQQASARFFEKEAKKREAQRKNHT